MLSNLSSKTQRMKIDAKDDSESEEENTDVKEAEEKSNNDVSAITASRNREILDLKMSPSTLNITQTPKAQQWLAQDGKWCAVEWDEENSKASFMDLFEIFQVFGG